MTELLIKLFVKNKSQSEENKRETYGSFSGIVGIITNFILAVIKFIAGLISSSVAMTADAFNNLSDAGSSLISLFSFKISSKPADRDHPFGHARMEYIASMIVSFLILLVGFELLSDSANVIFNPQNAKKTELTIISGIILICSIFLKLWLGVFYIKIGKKINSDILKATATDCFMDTISTSAVLVSSIIIYFTDWYLIDAIVGIAVSCLILFAGAKILNETKNALLGEAPVTEVVDSIKEIVKKYPDVVDIHDMMVHNYGPNSFIASFHAEVDGSRDIYELHDSIDNLEKDIKNTLGILCTVHLDPILLNDCISDELKAFVTEIVNEYNQNFTIHDFRVVKGITHTNLIFDVVAPFEFEYTNEKIISEISERVLAARENHFCVITVDRG